MEEHGGLLCLYGKELGTIPPILVNATAEGAKVSTAESS
jgi:hypothetical protein